MQLAIRALLWALVVCMTVTAAEAGKKDDTLVWATDRENPIADPYFINTRELVVIGHHVWDTLVYTDPARREIRPLLATTWKWASDTRSRWSCAQASSSIPASDGR